MKFECSKFPCHIIQVIDWSKGTDGGPVPYFDMTGKFCPICGAPLVPWKEIRDEYESSSNHMDA